MNTVPARTATTMATTTAAVIIAVVRCVVTRACRRAKDLVGSELMPGAVVTTRPPPSLSPRRNACLPANGMVATRAEPSHVPPEELRSSMTQPRSAGLILAWCRETEASLSIRSLSGSRPMVSDAPTARMRRWPPASTTNC